MIYEYEAAVLKHLSGVCPEIKLATYAKDVDMFTSLAQVTKMPSLLFYRVPVDWSFAASFRVNENGKSSRVVPVAQNYIARIYAAASENVLSLANEVRFYIEDNPYVVVPYDDESIPVAMRLTAIKVDEVRNITDKKGPQRFVEFSWSSNLLLSDIDIGYYGLVENVKIYLTDKGIQILNDDILIKTIL